MKGNILFNLWAWRYQIFSSQKAQVQVKSRVNGVKVQVKLQVIKFVTQVWLGSKVVTSIVKLHPDSCRTFNTFYLRSRDKLWPRNQNWGYVSSVVMQVRFQSSCRYFLVPAQVKGHNESKDVCTKWSLFKAALIDVFATKEHNSAASWHTLMYSRLLMANVLANIVSRKFAFS